MLTKDTHEETRYVQIPVEEYNQMRDTIVSLSTQVAKGVCIPREERRPVLAALIDMYGTDGTVRIPKSAAMAYFGKKHNVIQTQDGDDYVLKLEK